MVIWSHAHVWAYDHMLRWSNHPMIRWSDDHVITISDYCLFFLIIPSCLYWCIIMHRYAHNFLATVVSFRARLLPQMDARIHYDYCSSFEAGPRNPLRFEYLVLKPYQDIHYTLRACWARAKESIDLHVSVRAGGRWRVRACVCVCVCVFRVWSKTSI